MKYRVLGRTGLKVSELGFGGHEYRRPLPTTLGKWGDIDHKEFLKKQPTRNELIRKAIDFGINYYDATQPEEAKSLGMALKEIGVREEVHVALMILRPLKKISKEPQQKWSQIIREDVEDKLKLLQSGYTDILNVHMPEVSYTKERLTTTITTLKELQDEGRIKWLGASSHKPKFLAELIRSFDCFDSVMVRYNYHLQEPREVLFPLCKAREIGFVVMKPIAWPYYGIPFTQFSPIELETKSYTPIQTSLRWILRSQEVSTVVPGINTTDELEENLGSIDDYDEINEKILSEHLKTAQNPEAKAILEQIMNDSRVDIRYFAERALKQYYK